MFGIGSTELLVILLVALIVLGPRSLAKVSRSLGKAMGEFRRVSTDFQRTLNAESAEADRREKEEEERRKATADTAAQSTTPTAPKDAPAPGAGLGEEDSLNPPEGSPLAEALARTAAEAATSGPKETGAPPATSSPAHEEGPRA